ncbi:Cytochrome P450 2A9 [Halotydeus destructor]|nr:Cytochrome P450 2A9 [Halotydeus destructor]
MMGNKAMAQNDGTFLNVAETLVDFMRSTKGQATDYREPLSKTATNAITCALYSKIYDWKDKELEDITKNVRCLLHYLKDMEMLFAGTLFEWFMKIVHWRRHKQILAGSIECTALFQKMAEKRLREGGFDEGRDFFDHFLANHVKELDDNVLEQDRCFTTESLASTTLNLILAAADTTSETTYWALYFLAKHQNVQQKAQQELDDVIGPRAVAMADRIQLPYMAAFIEETHRMAALFPLGTTRQAVADIDINGVKIQKGSYVIPNIYSCLTDETYFKDPEIFDPSRFIDCNGKFVPIEADIPFTTGRRSCVGETFARVQLFITLCTILQNFNITFPGESCDVSHTDGAFQVLFPINSVSKRDNRG